MLNVRITDLTAELHQLQVQLSHIQSELSSFQDRCSVLESQNAMLSTTNANLSANNMELNNKLLKYTAQDVQVKQLETANAMLSVSVQDQNRKVHELEGVSNQNLVLRHEAEALRKSMQAVKTERDVALTQSYQQHVVVQKPALYTSYVPQYRQSTVQYTTSQPTYSTHL